MRTFGDLDRVGVEGTGTDGGGAGPGTCSEQVTAVEVKRPNRQVRRRHGKTDPEGAAVQRHQGPHSGVEPAAGAAGLPALLNEAL
jgi:hypothetical protein